MKKQDKGMNLKKKFTHKEIEYCELCLKPIYTLTTTRWCVRIVYEGDWEEYRFFHAKCFDDFVKGKIDMMKDRIQDKFAMVKGMLGKLMPKLQEQLAQ